jgi:hypothetical protein
MQKDVKINGYVVGQFPNAPLVFGLIGLVASWILSADSAAHAFARAAWLELTDGVNGFRRVLGAGGLVFVLVSLARDID